MATPEGDRDGYETWIAYEGDLDGDSARREIASLNEDIPSDAEVSVWRRWRGNGLDRDPQAHAESIVCVWIPSLGLACVDVDTWTHADDAEDAVRRVYISGEVVAP